MNPSTAALADQLPAVVAQFALAGRFREGAPHGNGHINDTFVARFDEAGASVRYIVQRINRRIFKNPAALMENVERVTAHAAARARTAHPADAARRALALVPTRAGRACTVDAQGEFWRCYRFVERTRGYDVVERPEQAFAAAKAFGEFQRMLVDLPGARLHETIPDFHHTRKRFENFRVAAQADPQGRAAGARAEIDFVFSREAVADVLLRLQARGEIPERVAHNDTKLNNVLLDETTNEGICVIDLDTVMPGLALHDFGEMVRTGTNSAPEDEPDPAKIAMRMPIFEALVRGYLASAGAFLNAAERAHLAFSGRLMTFENGLRFLTDHLAGDTYYKIKRPGHNLDRARNQFALLRRLEAEAAAMQALVDQLCAP